MKNAVTFEKSEDLKNLICNYLQFIHHTENTTWIPEMWGHFCKFE